MVCDSFCGGHGIHEAQDESHMVLVLVLVLVKLVTVIVDATVVVQFCDGNLDVVAIYITLTVYKLKHWCTF